MWRKKLPSRYKTSKAVQCRSCLLYLWYWGSFDTLLVDRGLTVVLLVLCFGFLSCMFTLPLCCWWNGSCQLWHWGAVSDFTCPVSSSCNQCYKDFGLYILYACTVAGLVLLNLALADQIIQCYIFSYNVKLFHTMEQPFTCQRLCWWKIAVGASHASL